MFFHVTTMSAILHQPPASSKRLFLSFPCLRNSQTFNSLQQSLLRSQFNGMTNKHHYTSLHPSSFQYFLIVTWAVRIPHYCWIAFFHNFTFFIFCFVVQASHKRYRKQCILIYLLLSSYLYMRQLLNTFITCHHYFLLFSQFCILEIMFLQSFYQSL